MKTPQKIAFVNQPIDPVLPPLSSSLGLWTYHAARLLAETSEVHVFGPLHAFRGRAQLHGQVRYHLVPIRIGNTLRRRTDHLALFDRPGKPRFASPVYYFDYATQVARELSKIRPDVIHVLNFSQFVPVLRRLNPASKIVLHMQCEWLNQMDPAMVRKNLKHANGIIGCSRYITDTAVRALPHFAHRAHTVYNGVDPSVFSAGTPAPADEERANTEILFVGRVSPEKGVHDLLQAYGSIAKTHPGARLKVIGGIAPGLTRFIAKVPCDDPFQAEVAWLYRTGYREKLQAMIAPETASRISFVRDTPNCKLVDSYRNVDVFVFPSAWNEPFGIPVIEAMACEKPVVATRSGGIPEIVDHGKTGLLVERGNPEELGAAISRLLDDRALRLRMGRAGRERVLAHFSWERVVTDLLQAYRELPAPSHLSASQHNGAGTTVATTRTRGH